MKTSILPHRLLLILCVFPITLIAQTKFINLEGSVKDKDSKDILIGATITIENTNTSTITNSEGDFVIKFPEQATLPSLMVKAVGYKDLIIDVIDPSEKLKIKMTPSEISLNEVEVIAYKSAQDLVSKVFDKKRINYSQEKVKMMAFYRETIKSRRKNASLAEAVVSIEKQPYSSNKDDKVSLIKSRKDTDYSKLDTITLKLQGGPFSTLYVDLMKYPEYIFTPEAMGAYDFSFNNTTNLNGRDVLIVAFKPNPNVITPLYKGELFISTDDLALQKATFSLDLKNSSEVNKMFVKKKPSDVRVKARDISYIVDYREKDGKWYYGYSKANLSFEVKKPRKLFKSIYTLSCEMAITDWRILPNEELLKGRVIKPSIIMANERIGFKDPDFWGEFNVIEPEKSIETAIKKIQRKLEKDDDFRASLSSN
ncbi:carboxypeptidase-like regulatory domain-containing protein [Dokdonia sp. Hel_I_53]|uniref:carboxypeptidase-like regulatory domain-containing protein n=1 Tax=Dokdonia sp. Hel_I_53 TaxID=1566287 RepID=UPI0011991E44|nr:carboxypeptidase-like regulatory domain-containing protein [Dokdonia sp. Hel_I_53]TVZ52978.1 carboxypeptidase-like protein [Dokdonia sp. Hel_I_53]